MAFEITFNHGDSYIKLMSEGWSGKIITMAPQDEIDRSFQFDIDFTLENGQYGTSWIRTDENSYGFVSRNYYYSNGAIGISLEHMGDGWWDGRYCQQLVGRGDAAPNTRIPAFGCTWRDNDPEPEALNVTDEVMNVHLYNFFSAYYQRAANATSAFQYISCDPNCNAIMQWIGWIIGTFKTEITTDLPIFATDAELLAWCKDPTNPETLSKMLNYNEEISPEEQYKLDQKYYYLHNIFKHNYHGTESSAWYNYRWKPGYDSKIRLYRVKPNDSRYYTLVLTVPGGLTRFKGPKGEYNDESAFEVDEDSLQTHFQEYSYTISRVSPKDVVTVSDFDTNIPIFGNAEDATKYANDELSIEDALNYSDILAFEQELPEPDFGEVDIETETGINGQTYMAGSAVYVLTRPEMIAFFSEIFKVQDPSFINAFKDGNVLFGDNQANAIIGCQYFPFDVADVCSLEGSSGAIWVGGWKSQNATGRKVNMNDKVLNIGEFFLPDMFKDVRDYEPYTNLYVQLPYCGTYQLSIQKYINKTVKINYAVDIFTGACTALIYANNILLDSMDGMIGSQRPVTGRTAANILQAITRGSASVAAGVAGGLKGGMALAGAGEAVFAGGENIAALGIGAGTQTTVAANALAASGMAIGAAGAGIAAVAGVDMMYKAKNAYADPPMATRGQYSGNLGMFGNQKVHFIVAIRHNYRPENELNLIGYPSGRGGRIGSFSGFLKSSCVYLADGFIGSVQERNEILEMIAKGIYI
jgi:hypothetical protein